MALFLRGLSVPVFSIWFSVGIFVFSCFPMSASVFSLFLAFVCLSGAEFVYQDASVAPYRLRFFCSAKRLWSVVPFFCVVGIYLLVFLAGLQSCCVLFAYTASLSLFASYSYVKSYLFFVLAM